VVVVVVVAPAATATFHWTARDQSKTPPL